MFILLIKALKNQKGDIRRKKKIIYFFYYIDPIINQLNFDIITKTGS